MNGKFIISLDFELHWGGVEKWDIEKKQEYFLETIKFIPELLEIFKENSIRVTWATVGFLFAKDKKQLLDFSPIDTPSYNRNELSYYNYFPKLGNDKDEDPFHFAPHLIQKILSTPGQELASHTFEHYYCIESGQTVEQFDADLKAAQAIAQENFGVTLKSLVFPRNQLNGSYLEVVKKNGIKVVRSNPNVWFWNKSYGKITSLFRAMDTLFPISKSLCFDKPLEIDGVLHLPASRFYRPYKKGEEKIQRYKIRRIKSEMTYAAKHNLNYHLWWHPHNFGEDIENNKIQLLEILEHFEILKGKYNFGSANMIDFVN
ncbi:polysaccharide deacetylase family protein [Aequorivita sp. 609]|uniref:polysaccharide deacetylase family protein n=1 Tax=Aequorivita TaxID=153265 RepID=UPI0016101FED|nr:MULTISPECIES: polysaccharide deacetylase family protein [Aequorivita]MBB6681528.1 polysaccharide deacetylase family protein [Aequorivita sp. 609]